MSASTLDIKLGGATTYTEWIISTEDSLALSQLSGTKFRVCDIATGKYPKSGDGETSEDPLRTWNDANRVALLTIKNNCEDDHTKTGSFRDAGNVYKELGRTCGETTTTEFYDMCHSLDTISEDRKSTIEHIAQYERLWNTSVGVLLQPSTAKAESLLKSPMVLEAIGRVQDRKQPASKQCEYYKSTGWKGIGHTEGGCFTKNRERKRYPQKAKAEQDNDSGDKTVEARICAIRVSGAYTEGPVGAYQYDNASTHHTTNELHRLQDVKEVQISVKDHSGNKSICRKQGTLVFTHNGREMRLQDCLYDKTFRKLISGQRQWGTHTLEMGEGFGTLKVEGQTIFKMIRDEYGALWIKPDEEKVNRVQKRSQPEKAKVQQATVVSERHENEPSDPTPREADACNWETWRTGIANFKSQTIRSSREHMRYNKVPADNGRALICSTNNTAGGINRCEASRKTSISTLENMDGENTGSLGILVLDQQRKNYFKKAQSGTARTRKNSGRIVRRRKKQVSRRCTPDPPLRATADIAVNDGDRIYCGLQGSEGSGLSTTIYEENEPQEDYFEGATFEEGDYNNAENRFGRSLQSVQDSQIPTMQSTHRTQVPLPEAGSQQELSNPGEGEPSGYTHEVDTYRSDQGMETTMDEYNWAVDIDWEIWNTWVETPTNEPISMGSTEESTSTVEGTNAAESAYHGTEESLEIEAMDMAILEEFEPSWWNPVA